MWCEVLLTTVARKSVLDKFTTDTKTAKTETLISVYLPLIITHTILSCWMVDFYLHIYFLVNRLYKMLTILSPWLGLMTPRFIIPLFLLQVSRDLRSEKTFTLPLHKSTLHWRRIKSPWPGCRNASWKSLGRMRSHFTLNSHHTVQLGMITIIYVATPDDFRTLPVDCTQALLSLCVCVVLLPFSLFSCTATKTEGSSICEGVEKQRHLAPRHIFFDAVLTWW